MQALYQALLSGQSLSDVAGQFAEDEQLENVDQDFFNTLIAEVDRRRGDFDEVIDRLADRPIDQIDPVERSVLYGALAELSTRRDVPYRVVINEAVSVAKRYGGAESHRYVNAVLDRAAAELRPEEMTGIE